MSLVVPSNTFPATGSVKSITTPSPNAGEEIFPATSVAITLRKYVAPSISG